MTNIILCRGNIVEVLLEDLKKFEKNSDMFEIQKIRENALRFSKEIFKKEKL